MCRLAKQELLLVVWIVSACGGGGGGTPTAPSATTATTATSTSTPSITPALSSHQLGVCGVTEAESTQTPTLTAIVIPPGDVFYETPWYHCMKVFGVTLFAVQKFTVEELRHVAAITAQFLDNNEDGIVDDAAVNAELLQSMSSMLLIDGTDKFSQFSFEAGSPMHLLGYTVAQHSLETDPYGTLCGQECGTTLDVSLEEVNHLLFQGGWRRAYADLDPVPTSLLGQAMDVARGGSFSTTNMNQQTDYPASAWYRPTDYDRPEDPTGFDAAGMEYFYWGMTTLMGGQGDLTPLRCDQVKLEWEPCTQAKLQATDTQLYSLLTNPSYRLPTVLPDGYYR